MQNKPRSVQEIRKTRLNASFVGRGGEIQIYRDNFTSSEEDRRFVFAIYGQGGIGKTWLLQKLRVVAESEGAVIAWIDESNSDVPSVMATVVRHYTRYEAAFRQFSERYKVYRQRLQELETDPDAPNGLPGLIGATVGKVSYNLAKQIPVAGAAINLLDEQTVADQASAWATFVAQKLANKDDINLVQHPVDVLTPLFLQGLWQVNESQPPAIFVDTYERTGEFLDSWIRTLFEVPAKYVDVPPRISIVLAGRDRLDPNLWEAFEDVVVSMPLEVFSSEELLQYLKTRGITDKEIIDVIDALSGRLPLLVATLAAQKPTTALALADPSGTAFDRFLKWINDPDKRQIATLAAVPRVLNEDVVSVLAPNQDSTTLFSWLVGQPFVQQRADGSWEYHEVVRSQFLRRLKHRSPKKWVALHRSLETYYREIQISLDTAALGWENNAQWHTLKLNQLYHEICAAPKTFIHAALQEFLATSRSAQQYSPAWSDMVQQAGLDAEEPEVTTLGKQFAEADRALADSDEHRAGQLLAAFGSDSRFELDSRSRALSTAALLELAHDQVGEAQQYADAAIQLEAQQTLSVAQQHEARQARALVFLLSRRYQDALDNMDYNRSIGAFDDADLFIIAFSNLALGKYSETLAILDTDEGQSFSMRNSPTVDVLRVRAYAGIGRTDMAIQLMIQNSHQLTTALSSILIELSGLANTESELGILSKMVTQSMAVMSMSPAELSAMDDAPDRGGLLPKFSREFGPLAAKLADSLPNVPDILGDELRPLLALSLYVSERHDEAILVLTSLIEQWPQMPYFHFLRALSYGELGNHEHALKDIESAVRLGYPRTKSLDNTLGVFLAIVGRYSEAVSLLQEQVDEDENDEISAYNLAVALARWKGIDEAAHAINWAHHLLESKPFTEQRWQALYGLGGLTALSGDVERALSYLEGAVSLEPTARNLARQDMAWFDLRGNPRFQKIAGESGVNRDTNPGELR